MIAMSTDTSSSEWSRARFNGAWTVMCWFNYPTNPGTWSTVFGMCGRSITQSISSGDRMNIWDNSDEIQGQTISFDTWYHLAFVATGDSIGDTLYMYLNGALDITNVRGDAGDTGANFQVGNNVYSENMKGRLAAFKGWNVALTAEEIQNEMRVARPRKLQNLIWWLPVMDAATLANRLKDLSGNGNDMSENGTVTLGEGPALSW
jgi:hypothetical protein